MPSEKSISSQSHGERESARSRESATATARTAAAARWRGVIDAKNSSAAPVSTRSVERELELAVVVPTLDERDNVLELIRRLDPVLAGIAYEIVVVDDDSSDDTSRAVRELARRDPRVRLIQRVGRRGLASACIEGHAGHLRAVRRGDGRRPAARRDDVPAMLEKLRSESLDLVVGSASSGGAAAASAA